MVIEPSAFGNRIHFPPDQPPTRTVIGWLKAQAEVIGQTLEGILVLDDIAGFLSAGCCREFAHPYLKQICEASPAE